MLVKNLIAIILDIPKDNQAIYSKIKVDSRGKRLGKAIAMER